MDIFEQLLKYVMDTNNGKGKELTQDIEGVTSTTATMSFYYSNRESADRVSADINKEFSVIASVIDDLPIGIFTVLIIPWEV